MNSRPFTFENERAFSFQRKKLAKDRIETGSQATEENAVSTAVAASNISSSGQETHIIFLTSGDVHQVREK